MAVDGVIMSYYNPYLQQNSYQPQIPSITQPITQQYQQSVNGIIKVNGRDSALQYQLPPNSMSPALFDNNGQVFYIVSTDGTGTKTIETFDFSPHVEKQEQAFNADQYVTKVEFDELKTKISWLIGEANGIHESVSAATANSTTVDSGQAQ